VDGVDRDVVGGAGLGMIGTLYESIAREALETPGDGS
jgi:hypothetical protein